MATVSTSDVSKPTINDLFLKNIDSGVTDWFKKSFPVDFEGRKTPVVFMSQERWALMQKQKVLRDESGVIIFPVITVRRLEATELFSRYVPKVDGTRVVVEKRVATQSYDNNEKLPFYTDYKMDFAKLINRGLSRYGFSKYGAAIYGLFESVPLITSRLMKNVIYEVVTAEYPTFVKLRYNITLYTSYLSQANQLQENIWKKFDSGRSYFKHDNYYIFATILGSSDQSNVDDFTENQRIIKYEYNFEMQSPLIYKEDIKIERTFMMPIISFKEL